MSKGQTSGDSSGWKRGEKGFAKDKTNAEILKPNADLKKLYGSTDGKGAVGQIPKVTDHDRGFKGVRS